MPTSKCPECEEPVFVDSESEQGDRATCEECHASLVVVGLDPIELDMYEESDAGEPADDEELGAYEY